MKGVRPVEGRASIRWVPLALLAVPLVIGFGYLLAFYPGIMSFDSVNQWAQLSEFKFTNWHPAYHTILMYVATRLWYSPAAVALLQVLVYALVFGYTMQILHNDWRVPTWLLISIETLVCLSPIYGLMVVTLWKDVLYGVAVLLLTAYLVRIVHTSGGWLGVGWNWVWFGLVLANVALLRHNGAPVAVAAALGCLLCLPVVRGAILRGSLLASLFMVIILGPVYSLFRVDREASQSIGVVFVHPIDAQLHAGVQLSDEETGFLDSIYPLGGGWPYSCYDATVLFYKGVRFEPVIEDPLRTAEVFLENALQRPTATAAHFLCLGSFTYEPAQPPGVQLETVLVSSLDVEPYPQWHQYRSLVVQSSRWPWLRDLVSTAVTADSQTHPLRILWRPAIYMYAFIAAVVIAALRSRNRLLYLLLVPVLVQTAVVALTAQLQALRYQYPVYLISMLFSLPLLYAAIRTPEGLRTSNADIDEA